MICTFRAAMVVNIVGPQITLLMGHEALTPSVVNLHAISSGQTERLTCSTAPAPMKAQCKRTKSHSLRAWISAGKPRGATAPPPAAALCVANVLEESTTHAACRRRC